MRILVIEDDAALAEALADSLRAQGWQTDCCGDGEEGLYLARMDAYDVLLVDRMLPGLDGTELVRCLRQEGHMVPVLMMTALDAVGDRVAGLDAGADIIFPSRLPQPSCWRVCGHWQGDRPRCRRVLCRWGTSGWIPSSGVCWVRRGSADCPNASVPCWGCWRRIWSAPSRGKPFLCVCGDRTATWKTATSTTMCIWCADVCPALEAICVWSPCAGWDTA